ncbi:hypothetical protein [Cupriavidus sp. Agwp_2]|uniref:hypothetical protein n=1 Tax=Cupriavidus sp. Agwp_2 TaxID=2897324 RepID=UPI00345F69E3
MHSHWTPATDAWRDFIKKHPELGLSGSAYSWAAFRRRNGEQLHKQGILRRTPRGAFVADADRFDAAAFDLVARQYDDSDAQAA